MRVYIKAMLHRPLSEAELLKVAGGHLSRPPFPPEIYDNIATIPATSSGDSLLDFWRTTFKALLHEVSVAKTWQLQRAELLRILVQECEWISLYLASQDARHNQSWTPEFRRLLPAAKNVDADDCKRLLFYRWLTSICTSACLKEIGARFYGVDSTKNFELEAVEVFTTDIRKLQISLLDIVLDNVDDTAEERDTRLNVYDQIATPLLTERRRALAVVEEEVINGTLDVAKLKKRLAELEADKQAIGAAITAGHWPPE